MKLRKTLSTLLAAALMVGMLCIPSMAATPVKVTGGYPYYNAISLSSAINEGTANLGTYHSDEVARPVRVYTVQAGTTLTVTNQLYVQAHPVTLLPDGTYEFKALYGNSNSPIYKAQSELWRTWTGYPYASGCTIPLNNSHVGTWTLNGYDVILKIVPMEIPQDTRIAIYQANSTLNIRAGAGTYFATVGTIAKGTQFEIYTISSDGCWGNLVGGGWVHLDNATFLRYKVICGVVGRQHNIWAAANTYRVLANTLAIHDGPHDNHEVVGTLSRETLIDVTEFYGEDWGYLANGAGWVRLGYNGNYQNVQFAAVKTIRTWNAPANGQAVIAKLAVNCAAGILPIRDGSNVGTGEISTPEALKNPVFNTAVLFNSPVVGYFANQRNGFVVELIHIYNDWGMLADGNWIYLPGAGTIY